jgi:hypothetical protein
MLKVDLLTVVDVEFIRDDGDCWGNGVGIWCFVKLQCAELRIKLLSSLTSFARVQRADRSRGVRASTLFPFSNMFIPVIVIIIIFIVIITIDVKLRW